MAITGAGRSRATESGGGQARGAKGLHLTRANGDCGVRRGEFCLGTRSLNEHVAGLGSVAMGVAARQRNRDYD